MIHNILAQHRALESRWHAKKIKLHQRLALRLFQEDVKQVLDWLQNHGEVFLRKNVGIGRNLAKARAYQKSHETFEGVVQNTYTNAEKLLAAAAELGMHSVEILAIFLLTQILREIDFCEFGVPKSAYLTVSAPPDFGFGEFLHFVNADSLTIAKNQNSRACNILKNAIFASNKVFLCIFHSRDDMLHCIKTIVLQKKSRQMIMA